MDFDIELATLKDSTSEFLREINEILPTGYFLENKTSRGWGVVIRSQNENSHIDLDTAIECFLLPLELLKRKLSQSNAVLRVGVLHEAAVCTLSVKRYDVLSSMNITLELSIYPSCE